MPEGPGKRTNAAVTWSVIVSFVLVAYMLSPGLYWAGHARWGWKASPLSVKTYSTLYYPLVCLAQGFAPAGRFYDWYFKWCSGEKPKISP